MKKQILAAILALPLSVQAGNGGESKHVPVDAQDSVELLHWWTSKGEAAALEVMLEAFADSPIKLISDPVIGGGGAAAKSILQARAIAGNLPHMAQMEGPAIQAWAKLGFLHDIDDQALNREWDSQLFPLVREIHQYQGHYVAAPVTIHRLNWMWVNTQVLARYNLPVPRDWPTLIDVLRRLQAKGLDPIAIGDDQWQVVQIFENIAFGVGGSEYYHKAFIELDPEALNSDETKQTLARFREISRIAQATLSPSRWEEATERLYQGEHAFQFTGDWALGELLALNNGYPEHIECVPFPTTERGFIYNMDSFTFFNTLSTSAKAVDTASSVLADTDFLYNFNKVKGSIPAQANVSLEGMTHCQQQAAKDFQTAMKSDASTPSLSNSMALSPIVQNAVSSELYRFFSDPEMSADSLIIHLGAIADGVGR
ncbi:ABC transporter substrate-binding protein [Thaumasiovibrio subtropicus]|uniref:ABC transporter substrate-binding protein n=1 Tax=Thaumasiovibrio subtropicus TaxID=1891207 RepID=UPI000B3592FA|nr:ABC transporter substrate-binding protein [Thaumasiovibrio subtropicus]